jgi:hypothetical protein
VIAIVQLLAAASDAPQVFDTSAKSPVIVGGASVTAAPPLFVAVTVTEGAVLLRTTDPKLMLVGERLSVPGVTPVPERAAIAGLAAKFPARLRVPDRAPDAVGAKTTATTQVPEGASEAPQVVD